LSQPSGWAVLGLLPQLVWTQSMPSPPPVKSFPHNSSRSPVRIVESGAGTLSPAASYPVAKTLSIATW
jgi:hypothetical protein